MVSLGDGMERAIAKFLYGASTKQAASESGDRVSSNLNKEESWPEENRMKFKKKKEHRSVHAHQNER